jgi:hypothetical protein
MAIVKLNTEGLDDEVFQTFLIDRGISTKIISHNADGSDDVEFEGDRQSLEQMIEQHFDTGVAEANEVLIGKIED